MGMPPSSVAGVHSTTKRKGIKVMMTREEYIESLRKLDLKVYFMGKRIENPVDHPIIRPSLNSVAMSYELAQKDEYKDLMTATSNITGKTINRFLPLASESC